MTTTFTQEAYNSRLAAIVTELLASDPEQFSDTAEFRDLHDHLDANELLLECDDHFTDLPDEVVTDYAHLNTAINYTNDTVAWLAANDQEV